MQNEIRQTWQFNQAPRKVWEYLTNPVLIEQWLAKTDFKPVVAHRFSLFDKTGKIISCRVLEVNPFTKLSYSWKFKSAIDNRLFDSKVIWKLTPNENGTELEIIHNDFTSLEDYTAHNKGWTTCIKRFTILLNT